MIFNELLYLKGRVLNEDAALLTKGSRNVLANKNLVASVAAALRDDIAGSPGEFGGKARELSKATDENLVIYFQLFSKTLKLMMQNVNFVDLKIGKYST